MRADRSKPDLLFVNLIHQALRVDSTRLTVSVAALHQHERLGRLPGIRVFFDHYRKQLGLHHAHEDRLFFPALEAKIGAMRLSQLTGQHDRLDADLQAIDDGLAAMDDPERDFSSDQAKTADALAAMADHLATHLTLEEETVLPMFEVEVPRAEYKKLEAIARKTTGRQPAQFMIPWIVAHATPDQRQSLFRSTPPLRLLYSLNRRRYRDLDGALVPAPEGSCLK